MTRVFAFVLFVIGMVLMWQWASFIAYGPTGPRWEWVIVTVLALAGVALWFDRRDAETGRGAD